MEGLTEEEAEEGLKGLGVREAPLEPPPEAPLPLDTLSSSEPELEQKHYNYNYYASIINKYCKIFNYNRQLHRLLQ